MKVIGELTSGFVVYKITNLENNKCYIGVTNNAKRRIQGHLTCARRNKGSAIHSAIRKYGYQNFTFEILSVFDNLDDAYKQEMRLIKSMNTQSFGYNVTAGGDGVRSLNEDAMARLKNSLSLALKGKPKSESHIKSMSDCKKGAKFSESHRKAISDSRKGIKISDNARKEMSNRRKGIPIHENTKAALLIAIKKPKTISAKLNISKAARNNRGRSVECSELGMRFDCIIDAADWLKRNGHEKACPGAIGKACRRVVPRAYGFVWNYVSKDSAEDCIAYAALKAEAKQQEAA